MIQDASRNSLKANTGSGAKSRMIAGNATAVIISSRPARKTPAPNTPSSTTAARRLIEEECRRVATMSASGSTG
jgi:hypothetical protein